VSTQLVMRGVRHFHPEKDQVARSYLGRAVVSLAGATFVAFVLFLIVLWNI
jgi:hypothetical protein